MPKPQAYSVNSPMATKPYAIGERPGGSYIPTIPLLSGTDAWDSLTTYYDPRIKSLGYDTAASGPRQSRDRLNKAAADGYDAGAASLGIALELIKQGGSPLLEPLQIDAPSVYGFLKAMADGGATIKQAQEAVQRAAAAVPAFKDACASAAASMEILEHTVAQEIGQDLLEKQAASLRSTRTSLGGLRKVALSPQPMAVAGGGGGGAPAKMVQPQAPYKPPQYAPIPGRWQSPVEPAKPNWPLSVPRNEGPQVQGHVFTHSMDPNYWKSLGSRMAAGMRGEMDRPAVSPAQMTPLQRKAYGQYLGRQREYQRAMEEYKKATQLNEEIPYWDKSLLAVPEGLRFARQESQYDHNTRKRSFTLPFREFARGTFPEIHNPVLERDERGGIRMLGRYTQPDNPDDPGQLVPDPEATKAYHDYVNRWNAWKQNRERWIEKWKSEGDKGALSYWHAWHEANPQLKRPVRIGTAKTFREHRYGDKNDYASFYKDVREADRWADRRGRYKPEFSHMFWDAPEDKVRQAAAGQLFKPVQDEDGNWRMDDSAFRTLMGLNEDGDGSVRRFKETFQSAVQRAPGFSGYGANRKLTDPQAFFTWANDFGKQYFEPRVNVYDELQRAFGDFGDAYYNRYDWKDLQDFGGTQHWLRTSDVRSVPGLTAYPGDVAMDAGTMDPLEGRFQARSRLLGPFSGGGGMQGYDPISRLRNVSSQIRTRLNRKHDAERQKHDSSTFNWLVGATTHHLDPEYMQQEYEIRGYDKQTAARMAAQDAFNMMPETQKERTLNMAAANQKRQAALALLDQSEVQQRAQQLMASGEYDESDPDAITMLAARSLAAEKGGDIQKKFEMFVKDADRIQNLPLRRKNYTGNYWQDMGIAFTQQGGGEKKGLRGFLDDHGIPYGGDIGAGTGNTLMALPRSASGTLFALPASLATSRREGSWEPTLAALRDMDAMPNAFWNAATGTDLSSRVGADHAMATGKSSLFDQWQQSGNMTREAAKDPKAFRDQMTQMKNTLTLFDEANNPQVVQETTTKFNTLGEQLSQAVPGMEPQKLFTEPLESFPEEIRPQIEEFRAVADRLRAYSEMNVDTLRQQAITDPQAKLMLQRLTQAQEWKENGGFEYAEQKLQDAENSSAAGRLGMRMQGAGAANLPQALDFLATMKMMPGKGQKSFSLGSGTGGSLALRTGATGLLPRIGQATLNIGPRAANFARPLPAYGAAFSAAEPGFEGFRWGLEETGAQPWLNQGAEKIRMGTTYDPDKPLMLRMLGELGAQNVEDPSGLAMIATGQGLKSLGGRGAARYGTQGIMGNASAATGWGGNSLRGLGMFQAGLHPQGFAMRTPGLRSAVDRGQQFTPTDVLKADLAADEQRGGTMLGGWLSDLTGVKPDPQMQTPLAPTTPAGELPATPLKPEQIQAVAQKATPTSFPQLFGLDPDAMKQAGPEGEQQVAGAAKQVLDVAGKNPDEVKKIQQTVDDPNSPAAKTALRTITAGTGANAQAAWDIFNNMDTGAKTLAALGVALGTISLISSLSGSGGAMSFVGSVLGFGAAAGVLAHGGVFGEEAQGFTKNLMGMIPGLGSDEMKGVNPAQAAKQDDAAIKQLLAAGQGDKGDPLARQFGGFMEDKKITPEEMAKIQQNPELQNYLWSLPDNQGIAALRALAKGDPQMAGKLKSLGEYGTGWFGKPIQKGLTGKPGTHATVMGHRVPGMGLTPEQAKRLVTLAGRM